MQCEVIKFPTIGAMSSVNPPYNPRQLANRGVVGHNTDRRIMITRSIKELNGVFSIDQHHIYKAG